MGEIAQALHASWGLVNDTMFAMHPSDNSDSSAPQGRLFLSTFFSFSISVFSLSFSLSNTFHLRYDFWLPFLLFCYTHQQLKYKIYGKKKRKEKKIYGQSDSSYLVLAWLWSCFHAICRIGYLELLLFLLPTRMSLSPVLFVVVFVLCFTLFFFLVVVVIVVVVCIVYYFVCFYDAIVRLWVLLCSCLQWLPLKLRH